MLSFMREQEFEDSSMQKPPGRTCADNAEETQEQEYLTVAAQDKNVRKTTLLLVFLFSIGLLGLLFMIKKSTPQTATAVISPAETQIEVAISRLTGIKSEMLNRMDGIVKKFYEFSNVQQVGVNELVKNPFERDILWGNFKELSDTKAENLDADAEAIKQQQLRQQAKALRLSSIMQSAQGKCCMIDDEILYEGDLIRGFKVHQISDSFVKLQWDQNQSEGGERTPTQIILKLSE